MKGQSQGSMSSFIFADVRQLDTGLWEGVWHVGIRNGKAEYDTEQGAIAYCKRNINRETGFTE